MTLNNLRVAVEDGTIELAHTALTREHNGYVSTKVMETEPETYAGEYGIGFITYSNNRESSRYCWKNYYIIKNPGEMYTRKYGVLDIWTREELRTENVDFNHVEELADGTEIIYMPDSGNYGAMA